MNEGEGVASHAPKSKERTKYNDLRKYWFGNESLYNNFMLFDFHIQLAFHRIPHDCFILINDLFNVEIFCFFQTGTAELSKMLTVR